jgi:uncharacterized protein YndB with AHSA1/START domain
VLSWVATNATTCSAGGGWSGDRAVSGTWPTPVLPVTTAFTLTCTGPGGTTSATVTVTVDATPATQAPRVTLSARPDGTVATGSRIELIWTTTDATACTASGGWSGAREAAGSETVGPLQSDATFTLTCTGSGGSAVAMTSVSVERIARVQWQAPTAQVDGAPLADLAGFHVYWGPASGSYTRDAVVPDASATTYDAAVSRGTWYFTVTARNAAGEESAFAEEFTRTID